MNETQLIKIISFYEFKQMGSAERLLRLRQGLKDAMIVHNIRGTILIAEEGFNGMVCGSEDEVDSFVDHIGDLLETKLNIKVSYAEMPPFRKTDVRIKPEIVTLKKRVDISLGKDTYVSANDWNKLISDPDTVVLDTRNDYEFKTGSFEGAINPEISKFSELPDYVSANLDPEKNQRIAMFCTGGIRCEKFAPYLKERGFREVFQLEGGILKYLEEVPQEKSLWNGECFVFDERVTVDSTLNVGNSPDLSQRRANAKTSPPGN